MKKQLFGRMPDGTAIELYSLKSAEMEAEVMGYGAAIISLRVPDRAGHVDNVVLSFPKLEDYVRNHHSAAPGFFGSTIGRYANRIAQGQFTLEGKHCALNRNNGEHTLHGGPGGFHTAVWDAEPIEDGVAFHYLSKDGEEGFPGNLKTTVRYTVSGTELRMEYLASTDKTTLVNLTNHSYFNLAGSGRESVLTQRLKLYASRFTPVDAGLIPTGELRPVAGTPFDFRKSTLIGERIHAQDLQLQRGYGYDHNFVLDEEAASLKLAAELHDPSSGRIMEIWTTEPAIQFYSGNFLDGSVRGTNGVVFSKHAALCLETQHFPDSVHHPEFPSTVLRPGEAFRSVTVLKFGAR